MNPPIRVVQYGLGPIGQSVARTVLEKQATGAFELIGAIDIDPRKVGRDVAALLDDGRTATGITVTDEADRVLDEVEPEVVLHTTTSFLEGIVDQLERCAEAGAHVVSSTEELAFPYERHPERAASIHETARDAGISIVGTGVNPGYAMDTLALTATGACVAVDAIHVERVVDAGERRGPLQDKVGAGLSPKAFAEQKATGSFGHIGLRESLWMLARGLGWSLDDVEEILDPVRADRTIETGHCTVRQGEVAGIHHVVTGRIDGVPRLTLHLKMYVGAQDPHDSVQVQGDPPMNLSVQNGIFGDTATVAMLVNTAPLACEAAPGLHTMADLPVPRAFATRP